MITYRSSENFHFPNNLFLHLALLSLVILLIRPKEKGRGSQPEQSPGAYCQIFGYILPLYIYTNNIILLEVKLPLSVGRSVIISQKGHFHAPIGALVSIELFYNNKPSTWDMAKNGIWGQELIFFWPRHRRTGLVLLLTGHLWGRD